MLWKASVLLSVAIVGGTLGTWLVDRTPPTSVSSVRVLNPEVTPGGVLHVQYNVYRTRSCKTVVERVLYDSQRIRTVLQDLVFEASPGPMGPDEYISNIPIPKDANLGEANYRASTTYRCNLLHELWPITLLTADVRFDIVGTLRELPPK